MATLKLTTDNFDRTVSGDGIVIVDCWAEWCGACKAFSPIYEKVALRHPEHVFGKLDTGAEPDLVASLSVQYIPSLLVYRDGVLLLNQPGNFDEEALEGIILQAVSLNMDLVRADIASSEPDKNDIGKHVA
ncbi:MAG: thioredoxin family protein [Phycisphaerae bacterium]|nr:thioredoxin family protein [Phycisphaerae bacterium]